ncbi:MAG: hypothetical protein R2939_10625 [Kofleriaceae bacterium]
MSKHTLPSYLLRLALLTSATLVADAARAPAVACADARTTTVLELRNLDSGTSRDDVKKIENALYQLPRVNFATVNKRKGVVEIRHTGVDMKRVRATLKRLGFPEA